MCPKYLILSHQYPKLLQSMSRIGNYENPLSSFCFKNSVKSTHSILNYSLRCFHELFLNESKFFAFLHCVQFAVYLIRRSCSSPFKSFWKRIIQQCLFYLIIGYNIWLRLYPRSIHTVFTFCAT